MCTYMYTFFYLYSYTLECNYNSGRQGNPLTAATMDNGRASPPVPPSSMGHRFSIQDFEQVCSFNSLKKKYQKLLQVPLSNVIHVVLYVL